MHRGAIRAFRQRAEALHPAFEGGNDEQAAAVFSIMYGFLSCALVFDVAHALGLETIKLLFVALLLAALMSYLRKVRRPLDCRF